MLDIIPLPALKKNGNYIWLLTHSANRRTVIVDPGEAGPLLSLIAGQNLTPAAILITHYHWDHVNGIAAVTDKYPVPVYAPKSESVAGGTHPVGGGDTVSLPELDLTFEILDVPGHTSGSIAYYAAGRVFTGDTLFTAGCGRLFEGTAAELYGSLMRLNALPADTLIYCGHEYTVNNLKFALRIEPDNTAIRARLGEAEARRQAGQATVPATLAVERRTNPFLRCETPAVIRAAEQYAGSTLANAEAVFAVLRCWKDTF